MKIASVEQLFEHELRDLYDAEKRLTKALPKMAKAAESEDLRAAFQEHLEVTQNQIQRLEKIFQTLEKKPSGKTCAGMKGLLEEGEEVMDMDAETPFADLALIGAARRVEHYEMAAYLSLQGIAEQMDNPEVLSLIQETLREEQETDATLSEIASQLQSEEYDEDLETEEDDEDAEELDMDEDEENIEDEEMEEKEEPIPAKSPARAGTPAKKKAPAKTANKR